MKSTLFRLFTSNPIGWVSVCIVLFLSCGTNSKTYARDGNPETTPNGKIIRVPQDKQSIQVAIDAAGDGAIVLVSPGVYHETITLDKKNITLASRFLDTGDQKYINQTILDGIIQRNNRKKKASFVIKITERSGPELKIIGFTVQNGNDGITCSGKAHILHNRFIHNNDAIDYEGGGGFCQFNTFENNKDDAVDLDGATEAVIADNVIRNSDDDGIEIRLHKYSGPTLNISIRNNIISGNGEDGIQLIDYPDISDRVIRIERNVIADNAMAAVGCMGNGNTKENYEGADIPERVYLINNTIVGNKYGVTGGDNLVALNNIFVNVRKSAMKKVNGESIAAYNLFWENGMDIEKSNVDEKSIFREAPLLDKDFTLKRGSSCIDAGTDVGIFIDIDGDVRPLGTGYDIGADEYLCWDGDGDGFDDISCNGLDCNDVNIDIYPGSDFDEDGFTACNDDCNDTDPLTHPGMNDPCDGIDNDCNGVDGVPEGIVFDNCTDFIDNDCDGLVDADQECFVICFITASHPFPSSPYPLLLMAGRGGFAHDDSNSSN